VNDPVPDAAAVDHGWPDAIPDSAAVERVLAAENRPDIGERLAKQDDAPAEPLDLSPGEMLAFFKEEQSEQMGALRGPILLGEGVGKRGRIWYRRPSAVGKIKLAEKIDACRVAGGKQKDINALYFVERALDEGGDRLFGAMQAPEIADHWDDLMVARVVNEIDRGSMTKLTDEQLGKS